MKHLTFQELTKLADQAQMQSYFIVNTAVKLYLSI